MRATLVSVAKAAGLSVNAQPIPYPALGTDVLKQMSIRDAGLPVSMVRETDKLSWYQFAVEYVDLKWNSSAATSRRTDAEALTAITMHMFSTKSRMPDEKLLRRVLKLWAFNTKYRTERTMTDDERRALTWAQSHTRNVSALSEIATVTQGPKRARHEA